jgi:hypothetical protein
MTTTEGSDASTDGSTGSGGSSGVGSSSGSGSSSGISSGGPGGGGCSPICGPGLTCCSGQCVNANNDPHNCGGCGIVCGGATSYCEGHCKAPPCDQDATACGTGSCCGAQCCGEGQLCCLLERATWTSECYTPAGGATSCPVGCPACVSDRNVKRDIEPVDESAVLEAVARLPVSTWSYKSDDPSVRHMGPMAQDFKASFGLGDTDRAYYPIDAHGVALASIQALYERVQELDARIRRLEHDNADLRNRCP